MIAYPVFSTRFFLKFQPCLLSVCAIALIENHLQKKNIIANSLPYDGHNFDLFLHDHLLHVSPILTNASSLCLVGSLDPGPDNLLQIRLLFLQSRRDLLKSEYETETVTFDLLCHQDGIILRFRNLKNQQNHKCTNYFFSFKQVLAREKNT